MACDATEVVLPLYPVTHGTQSPHHEWKIYTVKQTSHPQVAPQRESSRVSLWQTYLCVLRGVSQRTQRL